MLGLTLSFFIFGLGVPMQIKPGVQLNGIRPEIVAAIPVVQSVYAQQGYLLTITSGVEGKHSSKKSLHYKGLALDFRTRHVPSAQRPALHRALKSALGSQYDVILHASHLHVEWDGGGVNL